ncbi:MAG: hypothetical protein QY312_02595 [Candidatus Dojkabacteria bacterium]|nr:MAG: hypothetical protein QY312_02595 [Candidatus Dojkabacteria bacterium]
MNEFLQQRIDQKFFSYFIDNFDSLQKQKVLLHMADILYRKSLALGSEKELSLDDVFLVCLAIELRKASEKDKIPQSGTPREPLFTFLPETLLTEKEKYKLADRVAEYQLQYKPGISVNEDSGMLKKILLVNLMAEKGARKKLIKNYKRIDTSGTMILARIKAFWLEEIKYLAILNTSSSPKTTIENGTSCYCDLLTK